MNKYYKILTLVIAFLILSLVTVASFAYFSASVQGNDSVYNTVITTGEMALMLNDGEQVGLNNAIPGDSITKEFSVKNTGTVETTYDVYFSELLNEFEDKNDLVYTLTSENGCADNIEHIVPSDESKMVSTCAINSNQTHNYTLTITFKDDGTNQDDNKGKRFSTKISVNEYKEYQYIAKLVDGESFNSIIKSFTYSEEEYNEFVSVALTKYGNPSSEYDSYCVDKQEKCKFLKSVSDARRNNELHLIDGTYIKNIEIINEIPQNTNFLTLVSSNDSYYDIYVRYDNETIYIYTDQDEIYLNEDSSYLFDKLNKIENLDLKKFNTSNVINMSYMFYETTGSVEIDEGFNTSNVVDMHDMFGVSNLSDYSFINRFDTTNVADMSYMFFKTTGSIEIDESFNTSNVVDMHGMFSNSKLDDYSFVNNFDISNVTDMHDMFAHAGEGTDLKLTDFDASNVINMECMFQGSKFNSIDLGNNFNAKSAEKMRSMFEDTEVNIIRLGDNFNAKSATDMNHMFASNNNTEEINLGDNFNAESDVYVSNMFTATEGILDMGDNFNGSNISSTHYMFLNTRLSSINLDSFDTSSVVDASYMFNNSWYALTSIKFGEKFSTSNMTNMERMFSYCYKLEELYLGDKFVVNQNANVKDFLSGDGELKKIYIGPHSIFYPLNTQIFNYNYKLIGGSGTIYDENKNTGEYFRIDDPDHGKPGYLTLDPRYQ